MPQRNLLMQNSYLGYYAGFVSRLLAFVVDTALISFSFVSISWFISVTATMLRFQSILGFSLNEIPGIQPILDAFFGPVSAGFFTIVYVVGYHVLFLSLTGQTPGKALLGLRVLTVTGKRLSPWRAFLRVMAYLISGLGLYLGFLWVLWDDRRQAWHDKLTGTYVVYAWAARPDEAFLADELKAVVGGDVLPMPPAAQKGEAHRLER